MKLKMIAALVAGAISTAPAFADSITLDFEGATSYSSIKDFYNGGTDDAGASGINYGISFGGDAQALSNDIVRTYYSNAPTNGTVLNVVGSDAAMNVASGFTGPVSFYYSSTDATTINVYSGLNGTGSILGSFALAANTSSCTADITFCHWDLASINIDGIAQSIQFGPATYLAGFDNVSVNAVPLPAAAWLMLSALGGLGAVRRKNA